MIAGVALAVDAEMPMGMGRRTHRIRCDTDTAVGAILEPHRHRQAAGHFPVDLRFRGPRANGDPAQQVIDITGGHGLQQLGGNRQPQAQHLAHQFTGQGQAAGHVIAAIQVRVVGQAFPAHRGPGFLDVGRASPAASGRSHRW